MPRLDPFVTSIALMVLVATWLPAEGSFALFLDGATIAAIALLFFLHGARLPREALAQAARNWRLHALVLTATFVLFPLLGVGLEWGLQSWLSPTLLMGMVFMTCVPSTVQSSIAFTSIAHGNVAGAVGAAALSNVVGVLATPLLVALLLGLNAEGGGGLGTAIRDVLLQLLLPFMLGQLLRPWLASTVSRYHAFLGHLDRGSILLIVYAAFSAAVVEGLWQTTTWTELSGLVLLNGLVLAVVMAVTIGASRMAKLPYEDMTVVVFCGSKKSLASGVPLAGLLFPEPLVGKILLPLMIFHQIQLMVMAYVSQKWGAQRQAAK